MKKGYLIVVATMVGVLAIATGCEKIEDGLVDSKALSLYWGHRVFHEQGRGYTFEFYEVERSDNLYELKFKYQIDSETQNIGVRLPLSNPGLPTNIVSRFY